MKNRKYSSNSSNTVPDNLSAAIAATIPKESNSKAPVQNNSYTGYGTGTVTYGYGNTGYAVYYSGYQQPQAYTQQQQQPADYQTAGGSGAGYNNSAGAYGNQNWQQGSSVNGNNQYASQTEVTCAPGTENVASTGIANTIHSVPGVPGGHVASNTQQPATFAVPWRPKSSSSVDATSVQLGSYVNYENNQYASYAPEAAPTQQYPQSYNHNQWADYYSQTEVTCAPGTENVASTGIANTIHSVPGVPGGHVASNTQQPATFAAPWRPKSSSSVDATSVQLGSYVNYENNQYASYAPEAAPTQQYPQSYNHNQWADYYSQTEVTCAPGTENVASTGIANTIHSVPGVPGGHVASNTQQPATFAAPWRPKSSSSVDATSVQLGSYVNYENNQYASYAPEAAPTQQYPQSYNHNQWADYYSQTEVTCAPGTENLASTETTIAVHSFSVGYEPATFAAPWRSESSSSDAAHVQIPTNPRIATNLVLGLSKIDKENSVSSAAAKPLYISVAPPKTNSEVTSHVGTDIILKVPSEVGGSRDRNKNCYLCGERGHSERNCHNSSKKLKRARNYSLTPPPGHRRSRSLLPEWPSSRDEEDRFYRSGRGLPDGHRTTRLEVSHLPAGTSTRDVDDMFSRFESVCDVDVDRKRGFTLVDFSNFQEADSARHFLNGREVGRNRFVVEFAVESQEGTNKGAAPLKNDRIPKEPGGSHIPQWKRRKQRRLRMLRRLRRLRMLRLGGVIQDHCARCNRPLPEVAVITRCSHVFCIKCLVNVVSTSHTCLVEGHLVAVADSAYYHHPRRNKKDESLSETFVGN